MWLRNSVLISIQDFHVYFYKHDYFIIDYVVCVYKEY